MKTNVQNSSVWFVRPSPQPQARLRLFCFPYAGGSAQSYHDWQRRLPQDVELCAAQLPGRGRRIREAPLPSIAANVEQLASDIVPLLDVPFAFFGHSMGALLAFELARRLRDDAAPTPALLFASGCAAPHLPRRTREMHALPDQELIAELQRLNGTPPEVLEHPELMQMLMGFLRADFEAVETYRYSPGPPLTCPISALGGLRDPDVRRAELEAWRDHTAGDCAVRMFDGDHFFTHQVEPLLLEVIAWELARASGV